MNRRTLILSGAATLILPAAPALAKNVNYVPGLLKKHQQLATLFFSISRRAGVARAARRAVF